MGLLALAVTVKPLADVVRDYICSDSYEEAVEQRTHVAHLLPVARVESFLPAIMKGIMSRMEQGPLTGSYARDVRVIVYDGKMHPVDSNEISFMLAGRNAFSEAFKNAGPKILEPIYDVEVFVPSDRMGDVMGDLQGRRAMIMGMSSEKGFEKLVAKVPLKEMSSYSTALSSLTGGRASFIMKFSSYELVPSDVQDKLIKDFEAKQTEE